MKIGGQVTQTRLREDFALGITDLTFNPVCLDRAGDPQALPTVRMTSQCAPRGFVANPDFNAGLLPLDLTRGGSQFQFAANGNVKQYAAFIQDAITVGRQRSIQACASIDMTDLAELRILRRNLESAFPI